MSALHSPVVIWSAAIVMCLGAALTRLTANALLRFFAANEAALWHRSGEPSGLFSPPRGRPFLSHDPTDNWLIATPTWIKQHPRAQRLLLVARIGGIVAAAGLVTIILAVVTM